MRLATLEYRHGQRKGIRCLRQCRAINSADLAGETRTQEIMAKVVATLPQDKSMICEQNYGEVSALNRKDNDTAQVCMASKVLGSTTLPVAGFDDLLLVLPFVGTALGGLALLKKKH